MGGRIVQIIPLSPCHDLTVAPQARILIEVNVTQSVTMVVRCRDHSTHGPHVLVKGIPQVFCFKGLRPGTRYAVYVEGFKHVHSSFKTFPSQPTLAHRLNFAIVSCNKLRTTQKVVTQSDDVWAALAEMIQHDELDMALHLGDQVYADDDYGAFQQGKVEKSVAMEHCTFLKAMELLGKTPKGEWESKRLKVLDMYRQEYRNTWGHPKTREALANIPNIMIYDDHEIRDDLGDKPEDFDPNSKMYFIAECGRRAALEYQRVLHDDIDLSHPTHIPDMLRENHVLHRMGEYCIVMADCRAAKTFHAIPGDPQPFLTSHQFQDLQTALAAGGEFWDSTMMIFATQVPMIFMGRKMTERIAKKLDDFEGMWAYKDHEYEQMAMLNLLYDWTQQRPGRRIVLNGGDVHLGGLADLYRKGQFWGRQMTTGPISNATLTGMQLAVTNAIRQKGSDMPLGWKFQTRPFLGARNFGVIRTWKAVPDRSGGHSGPAYCLSLIHATKEQTVRERFWYKKEGQDREVWPNWERYSPK